MTGWENIELISDRKFDTWLDEFKEAKDAYPDGILIASVMEEYHKDAWCEIIERCQDAGVDASELNFSCPHGLPERKMGAAMGQDPVILAYKGALGIEDTELYQNLSLSGELGVVVTAHCENADLVAATQNKLVAEGKTGPEWHEPSRPVAVEAEGCHHLMTFAEMTGAEVYVVRTSCIPAVEAITAARKRGVKVSIETVAPYLALDNSYAELPDFEGAKYVMSPPLRSKEHQDFLWKCLTDGTIDTVGTDHATFDFAPQKHRGHPDPDKCVDATLQPTGKAGNFTLIPNGIPSIEERVKLLYTEGVCEGRIDLQTLVRVASTRAAEIFGLYPRKGAIAVGSDADLVVWDPDWSGRIAASTHSMATDYTAFEGREIIGRAELVTVREKIMVRNGEWVGESGHGIFLDRRPRV